MALLPNPDGSFHAEWIVDGKTGAVQGGMGDYSSCLMLGIHRPFLPWYLHPANRDFDSPVRNGWQDSGGAVPCRGREQCAFPAGRAVSIVTRPAPATPEALAVCIVESSKRETSAMQYGHMCVPSSRPRLPELTPALRLRLDGDAA